MRKALVLVGAIALTLPLAFLFWGIPAFVFPTVASAPDEAPSLPLWLAFWLAMPVLVCVVWLSAFRRVSGGGGVWLRRLSAPVGPSAGAWPPALSSGCVLACSGVEAGRRRPGRIAVSNQAGADATEKRPLGAPRGGAPRERRPRKRCSRPPRRWVRRLGTPPAPGDSGPRGAALARRAAVEGSKEVR